MTKVTIFGKGNMGKAIGQNFVDAQNEVNYIGSDDTVENIGEIVILAVPYPAALKIAEKNSEKLENKIVVDITNPLNFETWNELVVPANSSAAAEIASKLPNSKIVKAFNTTFAATLVSKKIGDKQQTTVLMASDDETAKKLLADSLKESGLAIVDAGTLKRARELEAFGFLQMTLAAKEKISWNGGFGIIK